MRFLLEYLPAKQQAVDEFARVCRPGGVVLIQDLDGQLVNHYPPDAKLEADLMRALRALDATGFDVYVGRKLLQLLRGAGLTGGGVKTETYHMITGAVPASERRLWRLKLDIVSTALERLGFADAAATAATFLAYLDRDDTMTFSHLFTVWAIKESV